MDQENYTALHEACFFNQAWRPSGLLPKRQESAYSTVFQGYRHTDHIRSYQIIQHNWTWTGYLDVPRLEVANVSAKVSRNRPARTAPTAPSLARWSVFWHMVPMHFGLCALYVAKDQVVPCRSSRSMSLHVVPIIPWPWVAARRYFV